MKVSLHSKIFLLMISCLCASCATGPFGKDFETYFEKPMFTDNFYGKITTENHTGDIAGINSLDGNLKNNILAEVERDKKTFTDDKSGREFHFTFHECKKSKNFPAQSGGANVAISILTIGIWPVGWEGNCQVDLDVTEPNEKSAEKLHFSTELEVRKVYSWSTLVHFGQKDRVRWALPARRLLKQYQDSVAK